MTYPIPLEALDDRLAFVGMTGSGKTYNAGTAVERLLPRARAVICDPLGVWWGLRLKADGETPAFPVVVFGGQHGDLPLTERAGAVIGEAAATMAESCELAKAGASPAMLEQAEAAAYARGHQHGARSGQRHMLTRVQAAIEQIGILGLEEPPENVQEVTISPALTSPSPKAATPPAPAPASAAPPTRANPAANKLLEALMRYPDRGLTWNEACAVAGILPGNGYFYGGRKALLENNVCETKLADHMRGLKAKAPRGLPSLP